MDLFFDDLNASGAAGFRRRVVALIVSSVAVFAVCLAMYTRHNDFSIRYHVDEPGKAEQVISGSRNYRHPLLLLEVSRIAAWLSLTPPDAQRIVLVGRWVSAGFAAAAVAIFSLAAYTMVGWPGFWLSAVSIGLSPILLINSHFMKEDTALVVGMSLVFLSLALLGKSQTSGQEKWTTTLVGVACGLAMSGKYVGAFLLAAAIPLLLLRRQSGGLSQRERMKRFAIAMAITFAIVNVRVVISFGRFGKAFYHEFQYSVTGEGDVILRRPLHFYLRALERETAPHVWVIAAAWIPILLLTRRRRCAWDVAVSVSTIVAFGALMLFVMPNDRYAIPAIILLQFGAALAIAWLVEWFTPRAWLSGGLTLAVIAIFIGMQWPRCENAIDQFAGDSRTRLKAWVSQNIDTGTPLAIGPYIGPLGDGYRPAIRLTDPSAPGKNGSTTLAALRLAGIRYVITSSLEYDRYFNPDFGPDPAEVDSYKQHHDFYEQLSNEAKVIWFSVPEPDLNAPVNPTIKVYQLNP